MLRERGINARLQNLRDSLKSRPERQVFAPRPLYKGRVYAADKDQRWAADIIVYDRNPAELDGRTYTNLLLVQDIFTRYAWAELMESHSQATEMFQRILDRAKAGPYTQLTPPTKRKGDRRVDREIDKKKNKR